MSNITFLLSYYEKIESELASCKVGFILGQYKPKLDLLHSFFV